MSNYNFREALKEVKEAKKEEISLEVDKVLRTIVQCISQTSNLFSDEMLNEIYFEQQGYKIIIFLKDMNSSSIFPYYRFTEYSCKNSDDALALLEEIKAKLKKEEFIIKIHEERSKAAKGFILVTKKE